MTNNSLAYFCKMRRNIPLRSLMRCNAICCWLLSLSAQMNLLWFELLYTRNTLSLVFFLLILADSTVLRHLIMIPSNLLWRDCFLFYSLLQAHKCFRFKYLLKSACVRMSMTSVNDKFNNCIITG